jgi:hypothetical protein
MERKEQKNEYMSTKKNRQDHQHKADPNWTRVHHVGLTPVKEGTALYCGAGGGPD